MNKLLIALYITGSITGGVILFALPQPFAFLGLMGLLAAGFVSTRRERLRTAQVLIVRRSPNLSRYRRPLALLASGLMSYAVLLFTAGTPESARTALGWTVAGLLTLALALAAKPAVIAARPYTDTRSETTTRRIRWLPLAGGVILLALLAETSGNIFSPSFLDGLSPHVQFVMWLLAPLLVAWGLGGRYTLLPGRPFTFRAWSSLWARQHWQQAMPLALILLLALAVRFWHIGDAVRLFVDEIHFTNPTTHFDHANDLELLLPFSSVAAFPYLYPYMQSLAADVLGRNLEALRSISAIFGALNVLALYFLARELFDRKTALLAAALLAAFPPHIHFSRLGLNNIADPFFGTMALYFIARGLRRDMPVNFAWAGVMLGLTQYFYEGGRLLFPALAILWLLALAVYGYVIRSVQLLSAWWQARTQRNSAALDAAFAAVEAIDFRLLRRSLLVLVVAGVLVGAPVYYTLVGHDRIVVQRLETAGLTGRHAQDFATIGELLEHITNRLYESLLIHVSIPESSLYYAGETPLLLGFVSLFFLLGVGYCLWCILARDDYAGALLVLLWILLAWLGNTLMQESRIAARYVVAFPPLMLAAAVGIRGVVELVVGLPATRTHNRALLALVTALVVVQVMYYFGPHLDAFREKFRDSLGRDVHDVLFRAQDFPADTHVYVVSSRVISQRDAADLMYYLNPEIRIHTRSAAEFTHAYLQALIAPRQRAFFVEDNDVVVLNKLQRYFPELDGPYYSPQDIPRGSQYALYIAKPQPPPRPEGAFGKIGVHLLLDDGRNHWPVEQWPLHLDYADAIVPDGGFVVQVVRADDLDVDKWQHFMDLCLERGLNPILRLATTFDHDAGYWHAPVPDADGSYTSLAAQYADFIAALDWPYPNEQHVIILNEPNNGAEWGGQPDPAAYARLFMDVAMAIKAQSPQVKILNAALDLYAPDTGSAPLNNGWHYINASRFIEEMIAAQNGIFSLLDIWNTHAYPMGAFTRPPWEQVYHFDTLNDAPPITLQPPPGINNRGVNGYEWELWKLGTYGVDWLPVMITETGWRHNADDPARYEVTGYPYLSQVAAYLDLAMAGNGGRYPELPSQGWTPWLHDDRVIGVVVFALNGLPGEWWHTNLLQMNEYGAVMGVYPHYEILADYIEDGS